MNWLIYSKYVEIEIVVFWFFVVGKFSIYFKFIMSLRLEMWNFMLGEDIFFIGEIICIDFIG